MLCRSIALALVVALPAAAGSGTVQGTVHFTGKAPAPKKIDADQADAFCKPQTDASLLVHGGKLENVWVHVVKGAPDSTASADAKPVVVDQVGCAYVPRVQALQVGQKILSKNTDDTLHNVHAYEGGKTVFNKGMPGPQAKPIEYTADKDGVITFRCDVHPWMRGYVGVNKNPFQAVTAADGAFKLEGLPAGTYTLEAWHEKLGTRTAEVTVSDKKPAKVTFEFDAK